MQLEDRINKIQASFQTGRLEAEKNGLQGRYRFEDELSEDLLSVGFEGCSMGIALQSLQKRDSLIDWHLFVSNSNPIYLSQIHVGLGWALAELKLPVSQYLFGIDTKWRLRILDGYGYYYGLFNRRETIRQMAYPAEITDELTAGFDQGVGRSIFYISKGEPDKIERTLNLFPKKRHVHFWRGIGIAQCFIGCSNSAELSALKSLSGNNNLDLAIGTAIACTSLKKAELLTNHSHILLNAYPELIAHVEQVDNNNCQSMKEYLSQLHTV